MDDFCQGIVDFALKDKTVMKLMTGVAGAQPQINCRRCDSSGIEGSSRAIILNSVPLEIVLCSNRLSKNEVKEALVHELIHAYDFSLNRVDFNTCTGLAHSEVRAAREAECKDEISLLGFKSRCIREKAKRSTRNIFPNGGGKCVDDVFIEAIRDLEPGFD